MNLKQFYAGLLRVLRRSMLLIDVRRRRLEVLVVIVGGRRRRGTAAASANRRQQQAVDDDVGVTADRRGEVRVKAEGESVVEKLVAGNGSGGEVSGDGHGVRRQIAQNLVDVRIAVVGGRVETLSQRFGRVRPNRETSGGGNLNQTEKK